MYVSIFKKYIDNTTIKDGTYWHRNIFLIMYFYHRKCYRYLTIDV